MSGKSALIAGATGLVGGNLLEQLLKDPNYSRVKSVSRSPLGISHTKLQEIILDFDQLQEFQTELNADHVFCCLGTTMKKAGSKSAFRKVDYDYPVSIAEICKKQGATTFILISAMGAYPNSAFFYNQVKGETEAAIRETGYDHYCIIRPPLILGERKEKRLAEVFGKGVLKLFEFFLRGPFRKYRGVHASQIASSMIEAAQKNTPGQIIIESTEIGEVI